MQKKTTPPGNYNGKTSNVNVACLWRYRGLTSRKGETLRFMLFSRAILERNLSPKAKVSSCHWSILFSPGTFTEGKREENMTDSASLGLAYTLAVGTVLFVALLILFEVLRRWIPDLYYWRNKATAYPEYADANGLPLGTAPKPGLFWPATVLPYSSSKLLESHGPDTVVFLRFLATQFQIFAVLSIFTMIVLVPTYATASNKNLDVKHPDHTVGVQILSLANVPVKDNRLWVRTLSNAMFVVHALSIHLTMLLLSTYIDMINCEHSYQNRLLSLRTSSSYW